MPIYQDEQPKICIQKGSKTGITEYLLVDSRYQASRGMNGLYVLPTETIRNRFIADRFDRTTRLVPEYYKNMSMLKKDVDAKGIKSMYGTTWAFAGGQNPDTFYEFDADVLYLDEFDKINARSISTAQDRLGGPGEKLQRKVGNPTITGRGIENEYELSDQRLWHIRCPHCTEWQVLKWEMNFVDQADNGQWFMRDDQYRAVCCKCQKPIDRLSPGEWVAKHPDREIHGYQVSRLFGSPDSDNGNASGKAIIKEEFLLWELAQNDLTRLQLFYNNRLGLPYDAEGTRITESLLAQCADKDMDSPVTSEIPTVAGCDTGGKLHCQVAEFVNGVEKTKWIFHINAGDYDTLHLKCQQLNIKKGVIDAMGDLNATRQFVKAHPGWYMCYYNKGSDNVKDEFIIDHQARTIRANRTESCDNYFAAHCNKRIFYPGNYRTIDNGDFLSHMTAPNRVFDEKRNAYVWDEGNKADHYFHAGNYKHMAARMFKTGSLVTVI